MGQPAPRRARGGLIGESWGAEETRDLARIAQAREIIGPSVELCVDANGGYECKQAIRMAHAMAAYDVRWYEEPVSSEDLDGLRAIRDQVDADVTAGEYGTDIGYFRRMCAANAVDCLQIDATRCGGYTEWLRSVAIAASFGLTVSAHCAPNLHGTQPARAGRRGNAEPASPGMVPRRRAHRAGLFTGALDPAGGVVTPDRKRFGYGFDTEAAGRYEFRR